MRKTRHKPSRKRTARSVRLSALTYASRLWEALDTPRSLTCYLLAKYGEMEQLVSLEINAYHYSEPADFFSDYQATKLLAKLPGLKTGIDTKMTALKKFVECEVKCRETNDRFRRYEECFSTRVDRVLSRASRKISHILGDVPDFSELDFAFGPGATYGVRGDTSVYKKVTSNLECTYALSDILPEFLAEFPGWMPDVANITLVAGSQLTVVPKNAKTDRPICIEPLLNGMYQKGFGSYIRDRLKRFGINLDDQSVNQRLAGLALEQGLATVDFSSASDTIAHGLVLHLLPIDWFIALERARCPRYEVDGNWYNFHKFSSMGNGYTFELETLIFYALAVAACEEEEILVRTGSNLSVYGDDVIIPKGAFDRFSEAAEACGFTINETKSFTDGVFYESCGHDFFLGFFCRPLQLTSELNKLTRAFYAANTIKRIASIFARIPSRDRVEHRRREHDLRRAYDWTVGCIPTHLREYGPEGYGDGHLIGGQPSASLRHPSWDGWWFWSYVEQPRRVRLDEWPIAYALYSVRNPKPRSNFVLDPADTVQTSRGYPLRNVSTSRRQKIFCHFQWHDLMWGTVVAPTAARAA